MINPIILSGGSGSRLWPLSRTLLPKQLLPLVSDRTMLQETALRLRGLITITKPVVIAHVEHRFLVAEQLRSIGVEPDCIVLESEGRNTAPAVAIAAMLSIAADPDATLLVLPADHLIRDAQAFREDVSKASMLAEIGRLVTFGIPPTEPATGYGYIRRGTPHHEFPDCYAVAQFVEKPDASKAAEFVRAGEFYWNSGLFLLPARKYLEELERFRPDMHAACVTALARSARDLDFIRLDPEAFFRCPSESIDYAIMENTREASVIAARFDWSDIGSWSSLWQTGHKDAEGNVVRGDVVLDGTHECYVRSEGRLVAAIGLRGLVIVETDDAVLVAHKDSAQHVKNIVERLRANGRAEWFSHRRVYRPWGYYESIDEGDRYQVKRIMVKPGQKISLQMHHHRAEHWIIVSGTARVTRGSEELLLSENQSTYIPLGERHRLENPGKIPLYLILLRQ